MPPVGAEETPLCGRHLIQVSVALGAETMDAPDPGMFKPHEQMMLELDLGRRARALRARSDRTAPTLWGRREGEKLEPSPLPSSATGKLETRAAMRFSISERPHPVLPPLCGGRDLLIRATRRVPHRARAAGA